MSNLEKRLQKVIAPTVNRLLAVSYSICVNRPASDISPKAFVALVHELLGHDLGKDTVYEQAINDYFMMIDLED